MSSGNLHDWVPGYDYGQDLQWVGIKVGTISATSVPPDVTTVTGTLSVQPADITTITAVSPFGVGITGGNVAATQSGIWNVGINTGARVAIASVTGNIGVSGLIGATQSGAWAVGVSGGNVAATQSGAWNVGINSGAQVAIASVNGNIGVSGAVAATQSGTWTVGLSGTTFVYATPSVASLIVSTYSASNAWATITLPAVASQYHFITAVNCRRVFHPGYTNQIATIQTTNLNSLLLMCPPIASITDTTQDLNMVFNPPMRSITVGTTTAIGMLPAGTNIKWSAYAVYYTGV